MPATISARFDSPGKLENAADDLVATGIPQDNIHRDDEALRLVVVMPETARPEIQEILKRHQPLEMSH